MTTSDYLDPVLVKEQCETAITALNEDIQKMSFVQSCVSDFCSDKSLQAEAYDALRAQMSDYDSIIQAMCSANEYDVDDYVSLSDIVGDERLDGKEIINGIEEAQNDYYEDYQNYSYWDSCTADNWWIQRIYNLRAWYYLHQAELDTKICNSYIKKANKYDSIEGVTSNLFIGAQAIRDASLTGLRQLGNRFYNNSYHKVLNATWRQDLKEALENRKEIRELQEELDISASDVEKMSVEEKAEFFDKVTRYELLLAPIKTEDIPFEKSIQLSPDLKATEKVEATVKGEIVSGNAIIHPESSTDKKIGYDIEYGDLNGESTINYKDQEMEIKAGVGDTELKSTVDMMNRQLIGMEITKELSNGDKAGASFKLSPKEGESGYSYEHNGVKHEISFGVDAKNATLKYKHSAEGDFGDEGKLKVEVELEKTQIDPMPGYETVSEIDKQDAAEINKKVAKDTAITAGGTLAAAGTAYIIWRGAKVVIGGVAIGLTGGAAAPIAVPLMASP